MAITKPPVLPAWADAGDKVQPSNSELSVGWPVSSTPPSRQRFNWALNFVANAVRYFSRRGLVDYDVAETYMIGDRVIGDDGKTYKCLVDNTIAFTPSTNPAKWARWGFTLAELNSEVTTPAQFDNTTKVATTAFVATQGVQSRDAIPITATTTLTLSHVGALVYVGGPTAGLVLTMPLASTVPNGAQIHFLNTNTYDITISRQGTDVLYQDTGFNTFIVKYGDTLTLERYSSAGWMVSNGSAALVKSGLFGSSLAVNGYQKLPSGLIIQWGFLGPGLSVPVTFPIAFTTNAYIANVFDGGYRGVFFGQTSLTTTGFTAKCSVADEGMCWFAIGK